MPKEKILIVDDEKNIVSSLQEILADEGYEVASADDGISALELIQADPPALILLDIWIPGMDGIEVLKTVKTYHPEIEVLVMSGHGTIDTAVKATKLGAFDFIEKPFSLDELVQSVDKALRLRNHRRNAIAADPERDAELPLCFQMMVDVKKGIQEAARTREPVLIVGEVGTGKEFIAQAIHQQTQIAGRPMVKLDCAVRTRSSLQEELFAPVKSRRKKSVSSSSLGGPRVVYLKNIDALPRPLQEKLAQSLKKGAEKKSDSEGGLLPERIFAATTRDLSALADSGQFNSELHRQLEQKQIQVPPLRKNSALIPNLIQNYFEEQVERGDRVLRTLSREALEALMRYHWPENLKELRMVMDEISRKVPPEDEIQVSDLPPTLRHREKTDESMFERFQTLDDVDQNLEREFLLHHLKKNHWDLARTAQSLNTDDQKVRTKLRQHHIHFPIAGDGDRTVEPIVQRTLKRSVVLCGRGLHSGIKTGLIMQPLPPGSGIIFGDISSGATIPARLENVQSTDYATCLKKGFHSVLTIEHIMAVLHMYRISNLLIKISDEAPVMDGSAKDFCQLVEDGEFEEQDELYEELVIDKTYRFGAEDDNGPHITIEPYDGFKVSYHMEYPEPIGIMDYTYEFDGPESFKRDIAPARTFGFVEEVAMLTKMGFGAGGKLDNFILLGDKKVLNTELRYQDEFARHKILDIMGDFYLLGKPIRGYIRAHKSGHTQNIGLLKQIRSSRMAVAAH